VRKLFHRIPNSVAPMRPVPFLALAGFAVLLTTGVVSAQVTNEKAKLVPSDGAAFDSFGSSVAISGTTAIVGAIGDEDNGSDSGSAYLCIIDRNENDVLDTQEISTGSSSDCNDNAFPMSVISPMEWAGTAIATGSSTSVRLLAASSEGIGCDVGAREGGRRRELGV
jgi:hypothetical protein